MKIALVSDTHLSSRDTLLPRNWAATERWLAAAKPDLLVHLGDITANGVQERSELVHARRIMRCSGLPMRLVPGNHDIGDHPAGPGLVAENPLDAVSLREYRRVFGPDRWSHNAAGWQIIGCNASLLATDSLEEQDQFTWLEETLREQTGPLGVVLHKPLFRDSPDEQIVHVRYVPSAARRRLLGLLEKRDLRFVAAGHTHQVRQIRASGVEHVWVPSTAFTVPDALQEPIGEKLVGLMLLEIDGDAHHFTHIIPAGMQAYDLMQFPHIYPALARLS